MATATMHLSAAVTGPSSTSALMAALSMTTSTASSNHSPFCCVHHANYAPSPPSKSTSSSASTATATSVSIPSLTFSRRPQRFLAPASSQSTVVPRHHAPLSAGDAPAAVDTSKLCACFVSHTFNCPEIIPQPPPPPPASNAIPNTLAHFVAYALHRTRVLHTS